MDERKACALLKRRFEAAGYHIAENQAFAEGGVALELDGFDASARVGYEYITAEAGDSWDVDSNVIAALDARRAEGEVFILLVDEADAPDEAALTTAADAFLAQLTAPGAGAAGAARKPKAAAKPKASSPKKKPATPAAKKKG